MGLERWLKGGSRQDAQDGIDLGLEVWTFT